MNPPIHRCTQNSETREHSKRAMSPRDPIMTRARAAREKNPPKDATAPISTARPTSKTKDATTNANGTGKDGATPPRTSTPYPASNNSSQTNNSSRNQQQTKAQPPSSNFRRRQTRRLPTQPRSNAPRRIASHTPLHSLCRRAPTALPRTLVHKQHCFRRESLPKSQSGRVLLCFVVQPLAQAVQDLPCC